MSTVLHIVRAKEFVMAELRAVSPPPEKKKRKSYSREFKLSVVKWVKDNNQTLASAYRHFQIDHKQIRN